MITLPDTIIDRASPVPYWYQLAGILEHAIAVVVTERVVDLLEPI